MRTGRNLDEIQKETIDEMLEEELKRVKNWRSYHNFLNNFEYVIDKPLGNQNLKGNNTYSMYNKNKTVAELLLRDEKDVLHFSDLYDKGLFAYQPETQLEMLNKLN